MCVFVEYMFDFDFVADLLDSVDDEDLALGDQKMDFSLADQKMDFGLADQKMADDPLDFVSRPVH
jgi:hypothetical protein